MEDHNVHSAISYSMPRLIRVNIAGHPKVNDGAITIGYLDPMLIESITIREVRYSKEHGQDGKPSEWYEPFIATSIVLKGGREFISTDTCEEIARLRERAINFQTVAAA